MTLGGEQRQANAKLINAKLIKEVAPPVHPETISGQFKVIFLTPTYFDDGWQPKNSDWSKLFGHSVMLKSAVLYRPLKIGGWNNAENRARAMHNYVTPGSVYYFVTDTSFSPPEALTQDPNNINARALGFGQYAIGEW